MTKVVSAIAPIAGPSLDPASPQHLKGDAKTVQARLGHANAAETLDTYSHLWPDSDDRTREAVDLVLGNPAADSLRTDTEP